MNKVYIVAEAGVNHNGSIEIAKQLIDEASKAGVDAVKFQSFVAESGIGKNAPKANYQLKLTSENESQIEMIQRLELSHDAHIDLINYCQMKKVDFLTTACDLDSVNFLKTLNQPAYKIASCDIVNIPLIRAIAKLNKKVFLSTGMANLGEVENAIVELKKNGTTDITLLHCTTEYPCPIKEVNLLKIKTLQKAFNLPVGFSDHTEGISSALASVSLGVTVIEKHFTLDKKMIGPDHIASINPIELNSLVTGIREVEKAIGSPLFVPTRAELLNINTMRRKIVASEDIKIGETFTLKNVGFKRSKGGLTPDFCDLILGKKASMNYTKDDVIQL